MLNSNPHLSRRPSNSPRHPGNAGLIGIYSLQTQRAAIRAAERVRAALQRDGDTRAVEGELATFQEREEAVGTESWRALEEKYLREAG